MILFAADNHYGAHSGRTLYQQLADAYPIDFSEDDWSCFLGEPLEDRYQLLILNLIADTCGVPAPCAESGAAVKAYLEAGRPMLLLHGASAAFWHEDWWRPIVGYRWVRNHDPDGSPASHHPTRPYTVVPSIGRHPLIQRLAPLKLPADEIYMALEQTCPTVTLLETTTDEGTFPQAYECVSPWGGRIIGYLPGHASQVVSQSGLVDHVRVLMEDLCMNPSP